MKNRPKSFPASSTFNEFLTQLKEEDRVSSSGEDILSAGSQSLHNPIDKNVSSNSNLVDTSSDDQEAVNKIDSFNQEIHSEKDVETSPNTNNGISTNSTDQIADSVVKTESVKRTCSNSQEVSAVKSVPPSLAELTKLLENLPTAQVTRQRFSRDEMQIRLSADLSLALRNFLPYLSLINPTSDFHIDDLVNHLVRQFVLTHLESIQQMGKQLAKAETSRQLQIYESLRSIESR